MQELAIQKRITDEFTRKREYLQEQLLKMQKSLEMDEFMQKLDRMEDKVEIEADMEESALDQNPDIKEIEPPKLEEPVVTNPAVMPDRIMV